MNNFFNIKNRYLSSHDDLINEFYKPVLFNSKIYKRMAGYFSSNLLEILYQELKETKTFKNIKIKIICSPKLSSKDKENITKGYAYKKILEENVLNEIDELSKDDEGLPLITQLILDNIIDIKFVVGKEGEGLFHAKEGIFIDYENNKLAFTGSNNETFAAVKHNFETTTVFHYTKYPQIVDEIDSLFNEIWEDKNPNLYQININKNIRIKFDELSKQIKTQKYEKSKREKFSILKQINLYPYQIDAINSWKNNQFLGLFEMATGTGKTITALAARETLFNEMNSLLTVIVVPQIDLVSQWAEEIQNFGGSVLKCNSEITDWKEKLKFELDNIRRNVENECIVITTIETFKSDYFFKTVKNYSIDDTLLIVDEVHSFAAKGVVKMYDELEGIYKYRLGVSATPSRKLENETQLLLEFFTDIVYTYTLKDAIENNYLNEYEYYPVILSFSQNELTQYREGFRDKGIEKNNAIDLKEIENLTSSIANASTAKVYKLINLLEQHGASTPKIVYCSPGFYNDGYSIKGEKHIEYVQRKLGNLGCKLRVIKSGVDASEREEILKQFRTQDLDTLLAIKCLDQGVNIKSVTHAYILSSTDSLTEFIQRRGRILRIQKDKPISKIYDLVMLPQDIESIEFYPSFEDAYLVDRELRRMEEYNYASNNNIENKMIIDEIRNKYSEVLEDFYDKSRKGK